MSVILIEGFDKYGGLSTSSNDLAAAMQAGDWTTVKTSSTGLSIVAGLSATGYAVTLVSNTQTWFLKTLPTNYPRLIGGFRFNCSAAGGTPGIILRDGATNQVSITIDAGFTISLRTGNVNGTVIQTSVGTIASGSTHYLEFDITIGAAGAFNVWLDGNSTPILSGTGNTRGGGVNNYANTFLMGNVTIVNATITYDDVYLFDPSGTTNNAVLLTSPRIETTWPIADSAVQFGFGAAVIGATVRRTTTNTGTAVNYFYVRPFRPAVNCTLNSIEAQITGTNSTVNLRPVVYTDVGGVPTTLMSTGATVTGVVTGTNLVAPLTTPQSLIAGTQYWLGFMADTAAASSFAVADTSLAGRQATVTFASGAPATAPATTSGILTWLLWGNVSNTGVNWYEVAASPPSNPPPLLGKQFVTDTVVGHKDLYAFAPLTITPTNIYAVGLKVLAARSDTGARTISARMLSGSTEVGGAAVTPGTTNSTVVAYFESDPAGGVWTSTNLTDARSGFRIDA